MHFSRAMIGIIFGVVLLAHGSNAKITDNIEDVYNSLNTINLFKVLAGNDSGFSQCRNDFNTILIDALGNSDYALKLLDASAKIPDGILIGNHVFFGQYYECLDVNHPAGNFTGKWCSLVIDSWLSDISPILAYRFGLCVPSSCSASDLNKGLASITALSIQASEEDCHTSSDVVELRGIDWFAISVIIVLGCLAVASTSYEFWQIYKLKNDKPNSLLTIFSIYRNGKGLFEVREVGGGKMDCLNGIRSLSMLWVILCHVSLFMVYGKVINQFDAMAAITDPTYVIISNGYLSVDTFFFLSGLLVAFVFFRDLGRSGSYDVPRSYLNRYLRLTPPYAMIVFMQVTIVNYVGGGPSWNLDIFNVDCENNWWTGLLYVQNIVNPNQQCLIQTWYLSADMQLYLVAPFLLYPMYFWPLYAGIAAGVITVASAFWSFGIGLIYELPYTPVLGQNGIENAVDNYVSWARVSPYLVGIMLGYLICGLQLKKIEVKLKPLYVFLGWFFSLALMASCMFGMLWFLDYPEDVTVAKSAAFLSFHRFGWAIGIAWMVFACIHGYGGPINTFLSWAPFHVLAKMSYSVYLVHMTVLSVVTGTIKNTIHTDMSSLFMVFITVAVYSHLVAIPLSLLVELPFSNIDRYFFRSMKVLPFPKAKPKTRVEKNIADAPVLQLQEIKEENRGEHSQKEIP